MLHIQSQAFHAIHGEVLLPLPILFYLPAETPSTGAGIADLRLFSLRIISFVFHRSRPFVVLVERVKILDVRLPVLFKIAQNGELTRGRVLCRWCGRSCQGRVVLVIVYGGRRCEEVEKILCERGCSC